MLKYAAPDLVLYQKLLASYKNCLKNKAHVKKTAFHLQHERIIHQLALDIENRTYQPTTSNIFVVTHPKPREVIAANMRDRVVHHFIHDYMAPYWERRFVPHSYACRKGKGPLQACHDLRTFIRRHAHQRGTPLHYLKVDIQNFFTTIDLRVLYRIIERQMEHPLYLWLCQVVIFHRATKRGAFSLTSPKSLWQMLPKYKSMFYAPDDVGLPIGNLTSQFFANVYMNQVDQYVTHQLAGRYLYWQRYVDDILFLSDDPAELRALTPLIATFLQDELHIKLNPKKTLLQPLARGLDHLGYFFKPTHTTVRRRVMGNCQRKVADLIAQPAATLQPEAACATVNAYLGHFNHAASRQLRTRVTEQIAAVPHLAARLEANAAHTKITPIKKSKKQRADAARLAENKLKDEFGAAFAAVDAEAARRRGAFYLRHWCEVSDLLVPEEGATREALFAEDSPSGDARTAT